jgi:glycosidase
MSSVNDSLCLLYTHDQQFGVGLNEETGLPESLLFRQNERDVIIPLSFTAELVTEGQEASRAPLGIEYLHTNRITTFRRSKEPFTHRLEGVQETYSVTTHAENWQVTWHYTFRIQHPRLELSFDIGPLEGAEGGTTPATLRDVRLLATFHPPSLVSWYIEAPGNSIRPGVRADLLEVPVPISPVGGVFGSTALVAFHQPREQQVLVLWPFSRTEIGIVHLQKQNEALLLAIDTGLAGRLIPGEMLHYEAIHLDMLDSTWEEVRADVPRWYAPLGLHTPIDRADWIRSASIFEVQIGGPVFWGEYTYSPYPTVRHLLDDLERIKNLGYTLLQIMPRQPYPSYNVHDYADITTSYGDEADLRELVASCHALGMRVILDILMHGVIDQEIMAETAARVRSGPYFARLAEPTPVFTADPDAGAISWSRHILDFEPHWLAGSPPRHPLALEHPEWFMRDSAQKIIGIYTKAFDAANPAWQEYFMQATETLVKRLDIDGFRFDAPTYNDLPNWSKATEKRASYSPLGCLPLFEQLRPRLKALKEDIILYTEPSGALFRQSMDITYNYEEQWLIPAVLGKSADENRQHIRVRNGRELATWFRDRNAVLPPGSLIAHHIDSHDTFWWPLPGSKWRREQFDLPATRALLAVFALSGGAYMTYVGGEQGIENEVRKVHHLRTTLPEIAIGEALYEPLSIDEEAIYGVVRRQGEQCSLLLVNLSGQPCRASCTLDVDAAHQGRGEYQVSDAWKDPDLVQKVQFREQFYTFTHEFEPFQVSLLVVRRPS